MPTPLGEDVYGVLLLLELLPELAIFFGPQHRFFQTQLLAQFIHVVKQRAFRHDW